MFNIKKGIIIILISLIMVLRHEYTFAMTDNANDYKPIDKIIIGEDINIPPYSFLDENGEPTGFNVEIAKEAAEVMGLKVEIRLDHWSKIKSQLDEGEIDVVAGMVYSEEREEKYDFTIRHTVMRGDIFTRNDIAIKDINDLDGQTVVVQEDDILNEFLEDEPLNIEIIHVPTMEEALDLIATGQYDYAVLSKIVAHEAARKNNYINIKAAGVNVYENNYTMAVKKGNENLVFTLNGGLNVLKATGRYQELYDKWFGIYEEVNIWDQIKEYGWVIGLILFILIILLVGIIMLRYMVAKRTEELVQANYTLEEQKRQLEKSKDVIADAYEQLQISDEELRAQYDEIEDYTKKLEELKEKYKYFASHDKLTLLPNRLEFMRELEDELNGNGAGAILLLDIDNFKGINDTLGHMYGDKVLEKIADALRSIEDENVKLSRFGGDEFLIMVKAEELCLIMDYVAKLSDLFRKKFVIEQNEMYISCSIGITRFPEDGSNANQVIMNADVAMYRAKESGKNGFKFFNTNMLESVKNKNEIERSLRTAIENRAFKLLYQPQVCTKNGTIIGYEALIRMKDHTLSPGVFIAIAEETNMIVTIGRWVTEEVIKQIARWKEEGMIIKPIAINFSPVQLNDLDYLRFLKNALNKYKVEAKYIDIEITENIFLKRKQETTQFLEELRAMGISVSLDDFGTGYSSFSYLTFLKVDKIKLDKSLTDKFLEGGNHAVMDNLISLAHSLNLEVVAEGIEYMDQFNQLKAGGCDYIQGYLFSKPVNVENVKEINEYNFLEN